MTVNIGLARNKEESTYEFGLYPLKLVFESKPPSNKVISPKTSKIFSTSKIEVPLIQTIETSEQPIITNSEECIDIKLKLRTFVRKKPAKRDISMSETYQAPFNSTKISSFRNILCGCCRRLLIKKNALKKILDMPSEHWVELIDCWMCHQENYKHAKIGDIIARENVGLVGNTYFLVHPNDVGENVLKVDDDELQEIDWSKGMSKKWISINCSRCLASIGDGLYCKSKDEEKEELILLAAKFNKYMTLVELEGDGGTDKKESIIQKCKFTAFLAADFLEATKVHATYRFVIKGKFFKQPYLLIWLFGWDSKIMTNALEECNPFKMFSKNIEEDCSVIKSDLKICDVMKILYIDCTTINQDIADDKSARLLEQWKKDKAVEHFIYQDDICLELLLLLRKSTSCLPASKKYMNDFSVGFMDMNG
ncbi:ubiquitin-conjugating enzyme E2-binding protein [Glomus cerebriforme]|uniref:Ubiquitin-conjugating enzyme E2-binding protein n=1 Tax=Glomus cerebriforme TaxID=658196 RepID=A0A397S4J6_9GLOM|nr:ubiquitin-conjugating enzyme E2-binding protein [Glomus cerebriforme]